MNFVDFAKKEIYKSIILSRELQSDRQCHIVTIQSLSLALKHNDNRYQNDVIEKKDTLSIPKLRNEIPKSYWIYSVDNPLVNINYGEDYIKYFQKSDTLYNPNRTDVYTCDFSYDIIKIYEPFDKWANLYNDNSSYTRRIVIPVKYEYLEDLFLRKEKHLIFKFIIDTKDKFKIIQEVIMD